MTDIADLKRRVEEATATETHELLHLVGKALGLYEWDGWWDPHVDAMVRGGAFLDATVALIERVMPGKTWIILNRAMQAVSDRHKRIVFGINADEIVRAALSALLFGESCPTVSKKAGSAKPTSSSPASPRPATGS